MKRPTTWIPALLLFTATAFAAVGPPNPSCDDIKKAQETLCAKAWHDSPQKDDDWSNYETCMKEALDEWLECIEPDPKPGK